MIRPYREDDLEQVRALFLERNVDFPREQFLWKKKAPTCLSWVTEINGRILAHYSVLELPFNPSLKTGFAVDAVFSPEHCHLTHIHELISHAFADMNTLGYDHVIGFANQRMTKVKKFLGWMPVGYYRWQLSEGIVDTYNREIDGRGVDGGATNPLASSDEYQKWRWENTPRNYCVVTRGEKVIARLYMSGEKAAMMIWADSDYWNMLVSTYKFYYLRKSNEIVDDGVEVIAPLNYSLNRTSPEWPEIWPLETVEGIALAW